MGLLATVVAVPTAALAGGGTKKYRGDMERGGKVTFKVRKDESNRYIVDFRGRNAKSECDQGQIRVFGGYNGEVLALSDGGFEFHGGGPNPGDTIDITGQLDGARKASGDFDQHLEQAVYDGNDYTNCNTGVLDWTAKKR